MIKTKTKSKKKRATSKTAKGGRAPYWIKVGKETVIALSLSDVADLLNVPPKRIRELYTDGVLTGENAGGSRGIMIDPRSVARFKAKMLELNRTFDETMKEIISDTVKP